MGKASKVFALAYLLAPIAESPTFRSRRMFGGLAFYFAGKMMGFLCETPGDRVWKGKRFSYDLWNGLVLALERDSHAALQAEYPTLVPHPVLPKWLYLPLSDPQFERRAERMIHQIAGHDPRYGIVPKQRPKARPKPRTPRARRSS